jgi:hypothetical protein
MRLLRSLVVVGSLCLSLGSSVALAAEVPKEPVGREDRGMVRILNEIGAFLKAVWEYEGCHIDPLGRCTPGTGVPDPSTPSTDWAGQIDPWG